MSFFGIPVPLGSDTGRKATFVVSGVAFGAAIGLLTRRPIRFGIIGAFIGPFVLFFALLILVVVFAAGD